MSAHIIGAFADDVTWNEAVQVDRFPHRLWSWSDNQLVNPIVSELKQILAGYRVPTSRSHPGLLSASYVSHLGDHIEVAPGALMPIDVEALNTGKAVWLATTRGSKGAVRLGARWLKDRNTILKEEGRVFLSKAVFPDRSYHFAGPIESPWQSGTYILEIGLVSEHVARFSDSGTPPVQTVVDVREPIR
jgi:hypothetical protein